MPRQQVHPIMDLFTDDDMEYLAMKKAGDGLSSELTSDLQAVERYGNQSYGGMLQDETIKTFVDACSKISQRYAYGSYLDDQRALALKNNPPRPRIHYASPATMASLGTNIVAIARKKEFVMNNVMVPIRRETKNGVSSRTENLMIHNFKMENLPSNQIDTSKTKV